MWNKVFLTVTSHGQDKGSKALGDWFNRVCVEVRVGRSSPLEPLPVETRSFLLALNALFLALLTCPSGLDQT